VADARFSRLPPIAAAIVVAAVYAFTFTERYAWSDDYARLNAPSSSFVEDTSGGRPLAAPLMAAGFGAARTIAGLRYLRAVSVLGVALLAASLVIVFQRAGTSRAYALFVAIGSALLPPFQMYAGWATAYLFAWVCVLSLWSGVLWLDGNRVTTRSLGLAGFVAANLIYQPAAFFAWVVAGVRLSQRLERPADSWRVVWRLLVGTVGGAVAALLIAWCVALATNIAWKERAGLLHSPHDVANKLGWIASRVLVIGARPFLIGSPGAAAAAATAGLAFLLLAYDWISRPPGTIAQRILTIGSLLAIPVFAMFPNAVVRENQIEFRILAGSCVVMWCYLCASVYFVARRISDRLHLDAGGAAGFGLAAQMVFVALAIVACRRNIYETMIAPNQTKDAYIAAQLGRFEPARHSRIHVVNDPDWWGRRRRIGTFSLISDLALPWVPAADVELKAREAGIDTSRVPVTVAATPAAAADDALIVDLSPLRAAITVPAQ
jgi:hypothetical protein